MVNEASLLLRTPITTPASLGPAYGVTTKEGGVGR